MRLDQWLWAMRLYKSRTLAAEAIKLGAAKVNGIVAKPSREMKACDVVEVHFRTIIRTLRVLGWPKSRVGAKLLPQYLEDLTPPEEFARQLELSRQPGMREAGAGRPTKRDRRDLERLLYGWSEEEEEEEPGA